MKKLFLGSLAFATFAFVSCSEDNELLNNGNTQETFSGEILSASSRTSLGENGEVKWSDNDAINLFKRTGYYQKYVVEAGGETSADFVYGDVNVTGSALDQHYAVYPYNVNNTINGKTITMDLSSLANQTYTVGSFENEKAAMVAKSATTELSFTNALSVACFKLSIKAPVMDATVNSIKISSTTPLTGTATVDMSQDRQPAVITGDGKEITLTCPNGIALSETVTPFYVTIPANTYSDLKITINAVINTENKEYTYDLENITFERSKIFSITKVFDKDDDWTGATGETITKIVESVAAANEAMQNGINNLAVTIADDESTPTLALQTTDTDSPTSLAFNSSVGSKTITIEEAENKDASSNVNVSASSDTNAENNFNINLPNSTVSLNASGTTATYQNVSSKTASETLIINEGVTVNNLTVLGGHVKVYGTVGTITRKDNEDDYTYVWFEGEIPATPNTDSKIIYLSMNETPVVNFDQLKTALTNGAEAIKFIDNIQSSVIVIVSKEVTIDGNGKKLESTADRAINVSGANGVTIKNLTIEASGERAINIIQNSTNVTIDNVTATAGNYTVNVATSAPNAKVVISNSTLNGLNVVNVASVGTEVNVTNSTINCNDNNATIGESYSALCLNKDAKGGTITTTSCTINVAEGSDSTKGRNDAENGTVTINGSTEGVQINVAYVQQGNYYYSYPTLAAAFESAKSSDVITLLRDITYDADETIIIQNGLSVVLDLNDKTIEGITDETENREMFMVKSNLTIKNGTIITEHKGENMGWNAMTTIFTVTAGGVLNLENVVAENKGGSDMAFVAHLNNWGEVTLNADNSTLKSPYIAVRTFNSGNDMNNVTIKNSTLEGKYCFWVHNYTLADFSNDATKTATHQSLLNLDIFNGTNVFKYTGKAPALYGFTDAVYLNEDGNVSASNLEELKAAAAQNVPVLLNATSITLDEDIALSKTLIIAEGSNLELDLNNFTITGTMHKNVGHVLKNKGTLTIKNGTISSTANNGGSAIMNNGTLTVEKVTLNGALNADNSWPAYTVNNTGTMTLNSSKVTSYHGAVASYGDGALVTMNDSEIDMVGIEGFTSHGIYTYNSGKVVVNGGTYANKAEDQNSTGASVINGCVEVTSGTFSGRIENYDGNPSFKGGTYSVKPDDNFIAEGYQAVDNGNGTYSVVAK